LTPDIGVKAPNDRAAGCEHRVVPGWPPRCELVVFPTASLPRSVADADPAVVRALTHDGVPKSWFYAGYHAARELRAVDVPPMGRQIRFATSGLGASLLVEPALGEVLFLVTVRGATPSFALRPDLYWSTFVDDMRAGVFASEVLTGD
jgi:hypothetical protein